MKRKHAKTLELIFSRPVSANVRWSDIEALFIELGGQVAEREGSRVLVRLFNDRRVFHRPHPEPTTDKGAVESIRKWSVYCCTPNGPFRAPQKCQDKARCAGHGHSLVKRRNAVMALLGGLPSGEPLSGHPPRCACLP